MGFFTRVFALSSQSFVNLLLWLSRTKNYKKTATRATCTATFFPAGTGEELLIVMRGFPLKHRYPKQTEKKKISCTEINNEQQILCHFLCCCC